MVKTKIPSSYLLLFLIRLQCPHDQKRFSQSNFLSIYFPFLCGYKCSTFGSCSSSHSPFILNSLENAVIYDLEHKTLVENGLHNVLLNPVNILQIHTWEILLCHSCL